MRDHWKFDVNAGGQGKVWRNGEEVHNVRSAVVRMEAGELTEVDLVHTSCDVELAVETYPEQGIHEYCDYWRRKNDTRRV